MIKRLMFCTSISKSHADDSELTDDDLIIRCEKGSVVGITVLNASRGRVDNGVVCSRAYMDLCLVREPSRPLYGIVLQFQESSIIEQKEESIAHANLKLSY
jgi:uncharacterized protein YuzE